MAQQWDAFKLLGIRNKDTGNVTCVGHAPSKGRRCQNVIAEHNRASGMALLDKLPDLVGNKDFESTLASVAERLLCRRWHQDQVNNMVDQWTAAIKSCGKTHPVPIKLEHSDRVPFARAVSQSSDSSLDSIFSDGDISDADSWREDDDDEDVKSNIKVEGRGHSKKSATDLELRVKRVEELASKAAAQRDEALEAESKARVAATIAETEKRDAVKREAEEKEMWKKEALAARDEAERKARVAAEDERREQQIKEERQAIQQEKEKLAAEREQFEKAKRDQIEEELAERRSRLEKEKALLAKIRAETEAIKEQVIQAVKVDEDRRKTRSQTAEAKAERDRLAAAEKNETDAKVARASIAAQWEFILPE